MYPIQLVCQGLKNNLKLEYDLNHNIKDFWTCGPKTSKVPCSEDFTIISKVKSSHQRLAPYQRSK